jgi:hypothetical protein
MKYFDSCVQLLCSGLLDLPQSDWVESNLAGRVGPASFMLISGCSQQYEPDYP